MLHSCPSVEMYLTRPGRLIVRVPSTEGGRSQRALVAFVFQFERSCRMSIGEAQLVASFAIVCRLTGFVESTGLSILPASTLTSSVLGVRKW
jgi:hypothetical protein